MKRYFIFLILIFTFFITLPTYALDNFNTSYNITLYDWDTYLNSIDCNGNTLKYEIDSFIESTDFDNSYYDVMIFKMNYVNDFGLYFFLIPKNTNLDRKSYSATKYSRENKTGFNYSFTSTYNASKSAKYFKLFPSVLCDSSTTFTTSSGWLSFLKALNTGVLDSNNGYWYNDSSLWSIPYFSDVGTYVNFVPNNVDSFSYIDDWFYYSSFDFTYNYYDSNSNTFYKNIHINDNNTDYTINDILPSYYDIYNSSQPNYTFIGYKESLDTFYTDLSSVNFNNYQLQIDFKVPQSLLGFYQTPQEYINNTSFNYACSGRINNTNYYSYELFPCSLDINYSLTDSNVSYIFNNLSTTQNISNYDKLYITIDTIYLDSNISKTLFDLQYSYSFGNFYNTKYKGIIYEKFSNLPLNFRLYLSSNNSLVDSNLYIKDYNFINYNVYYRGFSNTTNEQNLVVSNSILANSIDSNSTDFINLQVSNSIDTGIMIFQQNGSIIVPNLDLFFNSGIIISFNTSSNNNFYYIDSSGTIVNNNITINFQTNSTKYDISYYIGVVNDFILDINDDCVEFSNLTQIFYNGLPLFFQTFIFVLFVLFCIYFIYLLIKR